MIIVNKYSSRHVKVLASVKNVSSTGYNSEYII